MTKLKCELCGVETTMRSKISTVDGEKMVCTQCYNDFIYNETPALEIPVKPTFIRFYKVKFAKMGTYENGSDVRYILSIPKDRKEEFDFENEYDIIFIKRK